MAKILVIEDDVTTITKIRLNLQKAGHEVVELLDGRDIFHIFESDAPDIVLSDIYMPNQDGIETLIKVRELITDLPIIIMSGGSTLYDNEVDFTLEMTKDLGANATLKKPIDNEKLLSLIDELTKK